MVPIVGHNSSNAKHSVIIMKDHTLVYPELYFDVHILGPEGDARGFPNMFARAASKKAKDIENSDLVVFTGGADVNPAYYHETAHPTTRYDDARDKAEIAAYFYCLENGIPMLGVCRGAQFLHVMNGGKLYQHVDEHQSPHGMYDVRNKQHVDRVSSVHHQMVIPNPGGGMEIIGTTAKSRTRWKNDKQAEHGPILDIEAFWYKDTLCFGVQGHPEYSDYNFFTKWTLDKLNQLIVENPDVELRGCYRRLKEDIRLKRDAQSIIELDRAGEAE